MLNGNVALLCGMFCVCLCSCAEKTKNYVFTKKSYNPATESSPLFAVDCEMVSKMSFVCFCFHCVFCFFVTVLILVLPMLEMLETVFTDPDAFPVAESTVMVV